jgi:hypothetical protein
MRSGDGWGEDSEVESDSKEQTDAKSERYGFSRKAKEVKGENGRVKTVRATRPYMGEYSALQGDLANKLATRKTTSRQDKNLPKRVYQV